MTYRVWLTKAAAAGFTTATERKYGEDKKITRFQGLEVMTDNATNKPYVAISFDPINPTGELPILPKGSVRKVTFTGKYFDGFRNDGIYRHKGATARVELIQKIRLGCSLEDVNRLEIYQEIQISAGSVRTLREIYIKVRSGKIEPTEDWGSPMKGPSFEEMLGLMALVSARAHGGVQTPSDMN